MKQIRFKGEYLKLKGQKTAKLLYVDTVVPEHIQKGWYDDLVEYDTRRTDGSRFELNPEITYLLLIFLGDKNELFTTLREFSPKNSHYFADMGQIFKVVIIP